MTQSSHNTANYPSLLVYTATMHTKKKELILSSIFAWSYFFQVFNGFRILVSIFNSGFSREFSIVWCQKQNTVTAVMQVELLFKLFFGFPYFICPLYPFPKSIKAFLSFLHSFFSHKFYYLLVLVTYSNVHSLISILFFFVSSWPFQLKNLNALWNRGI